MENGDRPESKKKRDRVLDKLVEQAWEAVDVLSISARYCPVETFIELLLGGPVAEAYWDAWAQSDYAGRGKTEGFVGSTS